jgi:hypothetical protein
MGRHVTVRFDEVGTSFRGRAQRGALKSPTVLINFFFCSFPPLRFVGETPGSFFITRIRIFFIVHNILVTKRTSRKGTRISS